LGDYQPGLSPDCLTFLRNASAHSRVMNGRVSLPGRSITRSYQPPARAYGLTRDEAVRLRRDCIARERRSRFWGSSNRPSPPHRGHARAILPVGGRVGSGRHRSGSMSLPRASRGNDYFSELLTDVNTPLRLVPRPFTAAMIASEIPAAISPYSMAVAAVSSRQKRKTNAFITLPSFRSPRSHGNDVGRKLR
jgi:hypothetical protein